MNYCLVLFILFYNLAVFYQLNVLSNKGTWLPVFQVRGVTCFQGSEVPCYIISYYLCPLSVCNGATFPGKTCQAHILGGW